MEYGLAEAAVAAGVNRSTILRAIKGGKISARRLEDKSYRIDASELARVYNLQSAAQVAQAVPEDVPGHAQSVPEYAQAAQGLATVIELAELRVKVQLLERERETILAKQEETIEDLRRRLDEEREERRTLQRLLAAPERPPAVAEGVTTAAKPSTGFLARLLRR